MQSAAEAGDAKLEVARPALPAKLSPGRPPRIRLNRRFIAPSRVAGAGSSATYGPGSFLP